LGALRKAGESKGWIRIPGRGGVKSVVQAHKVVNKSMKGSPRRKIKNRSVGGHQFPRTLGQLKNPPTSPNTTRREEK